MIALPGRAIGNNVLMAIEAKLALCLTGEGLVALLAGGFEFRMTVHQGARHHQAFEDGLGLAVHVGKRERQRTHVQENHLGEEAPKRHRVAASVDVYCHDVKGRRNDKEHEQWKVEQVP